MDAQQGLADHQVERWLAEGTEKRRGDRRAKKRERERERERRRRTKNNSNKKNLKTNKNEKKEGGNRRRGESAWDKVPPGTRLGRQNEEDNAQVEDGLLSTSGTSRSAAGAEGSKGKKEGERERKHGGEGRQSKTQQHLSRYQQSIQEVAQTTKGERERARRGVGSASGAPAVTRGPTRSIRPGPAPHTAWGRTQRNTDVCCKYAVSYIYVHKQTNNSICVSLSKQACLLAEG